MTTAVTKFNPAQLPAHLRTAEVSPLAKALAGSSSGFARRLSIKGGVFRLIVAGKEVSAMEERYLDVVIVNSQATVGRQWYAKQFSDDSNQAPACWSSDGNVPDADVTMKQHENCRDCPKNVKGSGTGDTRACRFSKRLAIVLANDMEGDILQLQLPAKSIFGDAVEDKMPLQTYAKWLLGHTPPISPDWVVTRLRFDTAEESPKLYFKAMRYLEADELEIIREQAATPDAHDAVVMTVSQVDRTEPFQQPAPAQASKAKGGGEVTLETKSEPVPTAAATEAEPPPPPVQKKRGRPAKPKANGGDTAVAEPVVRAKAEAPQVPPREAITDVITQWDTDD